MEVKEGEKVIGMLIFDPKTQSVRVAPASPVLTLPTQYEIFDEDAYAEKLEEALKLKTQKPSLGWRELKKDIGFGWSHVTLMNRCKIYAANTGRYKFDAKGNVVAIKIPEQ